MDNNFHYLTTEGEVVAKVEIKGKQVVVDRKKIPLVSGEMHYWRLNPNAWKDCLEEIKKLGLNVVATYVPWFYHEYARGKFDFIGKTDQTRNLKAFLKLTKKMGFYVIIRPGPYIYSECPNDGVPDYAYKYHRLHPKFLEYAAVYLKKVCAVIKPFQATNKDGHIILLQSDNEIDPWPDIFGDQYGMASKPGLFQGFIETKYNENLDALNKAWGTKYTGFSEAGPYVTNHIKGDKSFRRNLDYFEFKYFYSHKVARWGVQEYKKNGIDIPVYLNLYPFLHVHDWALMQAECDLTGIDLYPENEFFVDSNDHRKFMDKVRYTRTYSPLPYIAEFASGVWHNHHYACGVLSPNHYRLLTLSAIAAGVAGWNWYMLVNRDNWYMAPINEWGRARPELTSVFKNLVTTFNEMKPYACVKLTDISVTFNHLQYAAKTLPQEGTILNCLYEADIDYEFSDVRNLKTNHEVLFYSGNQWLCKSNQKNLLNFVNKGGTLVCFRNFPCQDEYFNELNLLDFIEPQKAIFEFKREFEIKLPDASITKVLTSIHAFDKIEGKEIKAYLPDSREFIIGYEKKLGKGKIIHIGIEPDKNILFSILQYLNVNVHVYSKTKDIKTSLLKRANKYYLVIVNNGEEDKSATVVITEKAFCNKKFYVRNIEKKERQERAKMLNPSFSVEVPRKDGKVFELGIM